MDVGGGRGLDDRVVRNVVSQTVCDVRFDRAVEERRLLRDDAKLLAKRVNIQVANVVAVDRLQTIATFGERAARRLLAYNVAAVRRVESFEQRHENYWRVSRHLDKFLSRCLVFKSKAAADRQRCLLLRKSAAAFDL